MFIGDIVLVVFILLSVVGAIGIPLLGSYISENYCSSDKMANILFVSSMVIGVVMGVGLFVGLFVGLHSEIVITDVVNYDGKFVNPTELYLYNNGKFSLLHVNPVNTTLTESADGLTHVQETNYRKVPYFFGLELDISHQKSYMATYNIQYGKEFTYLK